MLDVDHRCMELLLWHFSETLILLMSFSMRWVKLGWEVKLGRQSYLVFCWAMEGRLTCWQYLWFCWFILGLLIWISSKGVQTDIFLYCFKIFAANFIFWKIQSNLSLVNLFTLLVGRCHSHWEHTIWEYRLQLPIFLHLSNLLVVRVALIWLDVVWVRVKAIKFVSDQLSCLKRHLSFLWIYFWLFEFKIEEILTK